MSTPDHEPLAVSGPAPLGARHLLRVLAATAVLATALGLCNDARNQVRDDLQLVAEPRARPGDVLALRAFLLADVEAPQGPTLARAEVEVRLLDVHNRELARAELHATEHFGSEGRLALPASLAGYYELEARVRGEAGAERSCRRGLRVEGGAAESRPRPRLALPLSQYALGARLAVVPEAAPDRLLPRAVSGSCVAEQVCRLLVWVGRPAATLSVRPQPAIEVLSVAPRENTEGLVRIDVRVHGPEAELTLEATQAGRLVATRALRLPVATGEAVIRASRSLLREGETLQLDLLPPPGRERLIVDGFREGRWTSTEQAAPQPAGGIALAVAPDRPGLWRFQARADPFSADSAAARLVYVGRPGGSEQAVLASLIETLLATDPEDEVARSVRARALVAGEVEDWAQFLLAPQELARMPLPEATSGRPAVLAKLAARQRGFRLAVGATLLLIALAAFVSLLRRGLAASRRAAELMREADPAARAGWLDRAAVFLWALSVFMAFALAALMIVSKSLWS